MNDIFNLNCVERKNFGSAISRKLRKEGMVPVTLLKRSKEENLYFSINEKDLIIALNDPCAKSKKIQLSFEGKKYYTLLHDVDFDSVTDKPISVEFIETDFDQFNLIKMPIKISNRARCFGVKIGGTLIVPQYNVEVYAKLNDKEYIDHFDVDVLDLKVNQSIKLSELKLPSCFKMKADAVLVRVSGRKALEGNEEEGKKEEEKN